MSMMGKAGRAAKAVFLGMLAMRMAGGSTPTAAGRLAPPPTRTNPPTKNKMRAYKDKRSSGFHQVKKRR